MTKAGLPVDETAVLARARAGDPEALEAFVRRYQDTVYRFGLRTCGRQEDAADVVQDSLLAALRGLSSFRGDSSVDTWLYQIARSSCLKRRRRSRHAPEVIQSLEALPDAEAHHMAAAGPDPEEQAADREGRAAVAAAIQSLPAAYRDVLVLRDVEGFTAPEVADALGLSAGAVKSRLHRARLIVRDALRPLVDGRRSPIPASRCRDIVRTFSRSLERELAPSACARLETHLRRCSECRAECGALTRTLALCRNAATTRVPPAVAEELRDAVRRFLASPLT